MHSTPRMDATVVQQLFARLRPLLDRVGEETGLAIAIGKATYTTNNAVFTVEAAVRGSGGVVMNRQAEAFRDNAVQVGLHPDDLGRDFEHDGIWFRVVGMKPRSKYPIVCARIAPPSPARSLFQAALVRRLLDAESRQARVSPHARVRVVDTQDDDDGGGQLPSIRGE
jgi:hypothetical protein